MAASILIVSSLRENFSTASMPSCGKQNGASTERGIARQTGETGEVSLCHLTSINTLSQSTSLLSLLTVLPGENIMVLLTCLYWLHGTSVRKKPQLER